MSRIRLPLFAIAAVLASVLLIGCPLLAPPATGSITITLGSQVSRTLLPTISMDPATYALSGSGPNGTFFSESTSGSSLTVSALATGTWTVTVNALNLDGIIIGQGSGSADVQTATTTTLGILVTPLAGDGTLTLTVSWPSSQVGIPSILASLIPPSGLTTPLGFSIASNQGDFSSTTIPAGYQTLTLQVLDNGVTVAGAVEVVRIVAGQLTTGSYTFTNVNSPTGILVVNIFPAMANPIPVSISGVASTITAGTTITATASVSDGTLGVVYVWYLNGVSQAVGPVYTFGSSLAAGYFRLDVTAYTADGSRAGSATANFQATEALAPGSVNLGTAGNFAILARSAVANLAVSAITGDIGISPAARSSITGFVLMDSGSYSTTPQVTGFVYAADMMAPTPANLTAAVIDMQTAYADAAGRVPDSVDLGGGFIGAVTLLPGVYSWGADMMITGDVIISGGANDVWIFQIAGNLVVESALNVILSDGARAKNIFWQVAGQVDLGGASSFQGILLGGSGISLQTGATMNGRALAEHFVALDQVTLTQPAP